MKIRKTVNVMKLIYLIRHCKAEGQDPSAQLTDEGVLQAEQLVEFFVEKRVDYIISSPFERAKSTVRPLAQKLNLDIRTDQRLSERILSTEPIDHWMGRLQESFIDLDMSLPGGEYDQPGILKTFYYPFLLTKGKSHT